MGGASFEGSIFFEYPENERQRVGPLKKLMEMLTVSMSVTLKDMVDNEMKV